MKVSDRDRNVKGKNVGCVKLISNLCEKYDTFTIIFRRGWQVFLTYGIQMTDIEINKIGAYPKGYKGNY